jgi:hypothetical protein
MKRRGTGAARYPANGPPAYPLKETVSILNDRLGLYLSEDQRRGMAKGLLIGTSIGAAVLAWNLTTMLRRR